MNRLSLVDGKICVDGVDLTRVVAGVQFSHDCDGQTQAVLSVVPGSVDVDCAAIVKIRSLPLALEWLPTVVDSSEFLERFQAALAQASFSEPPTMVMLRTLRDWIAELV